MSIVTHYDTCILWRVIARQVFNQGPLLFCMLNEKVEYCSFFLVQICVCSINRNHAFCMLQAGVA